MENQSKIWSVTKLLILLQPHIAGYSVKKNLFSLLQSLISWSLSKDGYLAILISHCLVGETKQKQRVGWIQTQPLWRPAWHWKQELFEKNANFQSNWETVCFKTNLNYVTVERDELLREQGTWICDAGNTGSSLQLACVL